MENKDKLIHQILAFDLIKLNNDLKQFNLMISEFRQYISNTDFTQDFSDESIHTFTDIAVLLSEMINAIDNFENNLIKLANSIKDKAS
ncbi:unknown [Clostridium sp. CAG:768]|mgnify:CR=1 FL=1|jgi:hypothetical protein|uniref:hypothetical protein n=1 Tax=Candidatus Stercorousia sp. TaxID=3048886 RepID=UPI0003387B80|nr:unknown [Clostridium sp. CAG:768]